MEIQKESFGQLPGGEQADIYTLSNANGVTIKITNFGGIITSVLAPDKHGTAAEIALGFDDLDSYVQKHPFFGTLVGRFANRIKEGKFTLDGQSYELAINNGPNHIHGGKEGFDKKLWLVEEASAENGLKMSYTSPDGEEGYPGTVHTTVTYNLSNDNELEITYKAHTDKATHVNLTNHSYFNLTGGKEETILNHVVKIAADAFVPVNSNQIPTGELEPVAGTAMDFKTPQVVGTRIDEVEGGYDHTYVVPHADGSLKYIASAFDPESGRLLETFTTQPGVQFYTGNNLTGSVKDRAGKTVEKYRALCFETQHYPDSPNQPQFPSTVLRPGDTYLQTTVYKFSVAEGI